MTAVPSNTLKDLALEKKREYARQYYQDHKGEARYYYKSNRKKIKARSKMWQKDNRKRYLKRQQYYDLFIRGNPSVEEQIARCNKRAIRIRSRALREQYLTRQ